MQNSGHKRSAYFSKLNLSFLENFFHLGFIQVSNVIIQILFFPLIIRIVGLEKFGVVMVANSVALLGGLIVNYGTGLSGIKDVSMYQSNLVILQEKISRIFFTRLFLAITLLLALPILYIAKYNLSYLLLAIPIFLTEIVNPLFFFTGLEKLSLFNLANLVSKITSALLIILLIKKPESAPWVNFYLGVPNLIFYTGLSFYFFKKNGIGKLATDFSEIVKLLKENFYLVGNNISVQLQQSFFLFAIAYAHYPLILGAYSLCDKIVWSSRLLLTAFSGAVFPKAIQLFHKSPLEWLFFKRKTNYYLSILFALGGIVLFFLAPFITKILVGKEDLLTSSFIRAISFVPLVISLNVLNVLDLLIRNRYSDMFKIGMVQLLITILVSLTLTIFHLSHLFGYYPLILDSCAIPLYLYYINKVSKNNALNE